jgi:hypothetical protein
MSDEEDIGGTCPACDDVCYRIDYEGPPCKLCGSAGRVDMERSYRCRWCDKPVSTPSGPCKDCWLNV